MDLLLLIATGLAALGLGVYLGLPRVEGAPAWRRGTRSLRSAPRANAAGEEGGTAGCDAAEPPQPAASDEAREQTAQRKKFLRRRVNPLDLLRLDERGSARRRARRPFQMSPDRPRGSAPVEPPTGDGADQRRPPCGSVEERSRQ